tara:strand:- start:13096 stop:13653 length:558 start_codon:yes stop_codon:yes gene_type:complete
METAPHKFEFNLIVAEQEAVSRRLGALLFKPGSQILMYAVMLPVAGVIMFTAYLLCAFALRPIQLENWAILPAVIIMTITWRPVALRICQRMMRGVIKLDKRAGDPITVEVGPDGVRWSSPGFEGKAAWSAIDAVVDAPEAIVFAIGGMAYYVPRRSVPDEPSRLELIASCIPFLTPEARAKSGL